jgi:hypothetical protein
MRTLLVLSLALLPMPAGANCRREAHQAWKMALQVCRGVVTTTIPTTTTTAPQVTLQSPSENCEPLECLPPVNGEPFCSFLQTITKCHFPVPSPACHLDLATDEQGSGTPCVLCDGTRYCASDR